MNMANSDYHEQEFDYSADFNRRTDRSKAPDQRRKANYSRTSKAPVSHNGIHRRRNKRFSW
jgi:hypothetical protein